MPWRRANPTTCARLCRCSLSRMLRTWNLTVFSLTPSFLASLWFEVTPRDQQLEHLALAVGQGVGVVGLGRRARRAGELLEQLARQQRRQRRLAAAHPLEQGEELPRLEVLEQVALAPDLIASKSLASSSEAVRMTTFTSGISALIRRVAARPSSPGIARSMRTISGRRRRASSTASLPFRASPTTSKPRGRAGCAGCPGTACGRPRSRFSSPAPLLHPWNPDRDAFLVYSIPPSGSRVPLLPPRAAHSSKRCAALPSRLACRHDRLAGAATPPSSPAPSRRCG